jgi:hypothetical protein
MNTEDLIVRQWLENNPYDPTVLPKGWEIRFGLRGKFLKYDSIGHAERKNMILVRETNELVPFGYCNELWQRLKSNFQENDELWLHGNDCGMAVYLIRNGEIQYTNDGKYRYPKKDFYLPLSYF